MPTDPWTLVLFCALLFCQKIHLLCFWPFYLILTPSIQHHKGPKNYLKLEPFSVCSKGYGVEQTKPEPSSSVNYFCPITFIIIIKCKASQTCPKCVHVACTGSFPRTIPIQKQYFVENGDSHLPLVNDARKSNMIAPSLKGFTQLSFG